MRERQSEQSALINHPAAARPDLAALDNTNAYLSLLREALTVTSHSDDGLVEWSFPPQFAVKVFVAQVAHLSPATLKPSLPVGLCIQH